MECDVCGGQLAVLGSLGSHEWYRCVDCGMEASVIVSGGNPIADYSEEEQSDDKEDA